MMRPNQRGATLISTMIGLLLGLFAVLSVMTLYKTQVDQTKQTRTNASIDGQVASALLVVQLEVQQAGFGVEVVTPPVTVPPTPTPDSCLGTATAGPSGTANHDVVILSSATLGTTLSPNTLAGTEQSILTQPPAGTAVVVATGNAVVWRSVDAVSQCSGLIAVGGGLKLLPRVPCTDATTWASLSWPAALAQDVVVAGTLAEDMLFTAELASCAPFGRHTASQSLQLTTTVGQSTDGIKSALVSCIPNICR